MKEKKLMTVGRNSYVSLFKHHYSVPKEHVGKRVTILYDADTVEIYCGMNLVAAHARSDVPYAYSWKKEHNLPGHYGPYDKDLEELFRRASEMDNIVLNYLREVERLMQYPPKAFRACRGIPTLEKSTGVTVWWRPAPAQTRSCNTDIRPYARCLNWEKTRISFPMRTEGHSPSGLPCATAPQEHTRT
ncbi:Mu transposase domain-containing protein [Hallella seregens]